VFRRWYMDSGLAPGDRITILSSGSFPGLAISALAAAESMKLDITLMASLGSSSWGANTLSMPISEMFRVLRSRGLVRTRPIAYTLGGGGDTGGGIEAEAVEVLLRSASIDEVPVLKEKIIADLIRIKSGMVLLPGTKLLVQIGGSNSDLGTDPSSLDLPPGLIVPGTVKNPGNGVIAEALSAGIPVLHILNIPLLARMEGITSDPSPPWKRSPIRFITAASAGALLLWKYRRWGVED
jgi:poly-gamma-glutamate system protein